MRLVIFSVDEVIFFCVVVNWRRLLGFVFLVGNGYGGYGWGCVINLGYIVMYMEMVSECFFC